MTSPKRANIDAQVDYSLAEGFTVESGATIGGVAVAHVPTKDEPWTDVTVTIRTAGEVTIRP